MIKARYDKDEDQYLVRSVNSHEQGEWYYCQGCVMKHKKPYNHHTNCPRSKAMDGEE
tara:strand:+ start:138 stop:308 length:171 start_codon:yes stop_codon:yes gene_type:complete